MEFNQNDLVGIVCDGHRTKRRDKNRDGIRKRYSVRTTRAYVGLLGQLKESESGFEIYLNNNKSDYTHTPWILDMDKKWAHLDLKNPRSTTLIYADDYKMVGSCSKFKRAVVHKADEYNAKYRQDRINFKLTLAYLEAAKRYFTAKTP